MVDGASEARESELVVQADGHVSGRPGQSPQDSILKHDTRMDIRPVRHAVFVWLLFVLHSVRHTTTPNFSTGDFEVLDTSASYSTITYYILTTMNY